MLMTTVCGFIQMYFPCGMYKPTQRLMRPPGFYRHMVLVGCTRYTKYGSQFVFYVCVFMLPIECHKPAVLCCICWPCLSLSMCLLIRQLSYSRFPYLLIDDMTLRIFVTSRVEYRHFLEYLWSLVLYIAF